MGDVLRTNVALLPPQERHGGVPIVKRLALAFLVIGGLCLVWSTMFPPPWFLDVTRWRVSWKLSDIDLVRSHDMHAEAEFAGDPRTYWVDLQLLAGPPMTFWGVSPESFDSPDSLVLRRIDGHSLSCDHETPGRASVGMDVLSRNNSATSQLGIENLNDALEKAADLRDAMLALGNCTSITYWGKPRVCHATPPGDR